MKHISTLSFLLLTLLGYSQADWSVINESNLDASIVGEREVIPSQYLVTTVDQASIKKKLKKSSIDNRQNETSGSQLISLPLPTGELHEFYVYNSPVFHPDLTAKYPHISTYRAVSSTNHLISARLGITGKGLHATIRHPDGEVYIDPYGSESDEYYISYFTRDFEAPASYPKSACGVEYNPNDMIEHFGTHELQKVGTASFLKKYRFALACTGEWGQNFGSKAAVLDQMAIALNRINESLENEASIFFELIGNNDEIIFLDPVTDPYSIVANNEDGVHPGRQVLAQNTGVINANVGAGNYDVGHVFTRSCTDGIAGVAALASVCTDNKGAGISCVGGANLVNFMVSTTLHEIGHQFGASHTWSNCGGNAEDQIAPGTAMEPGSGTTFMSYAGVCGGNTNIAGTNDAYFHVASLQQMYNLLENGNGSLCGEDVDVGNTAPESLHEYEDGFSIPIFTPFELTGSGFDMEGDSLTYCWEQMNTGPISPVGSPLGDAPAFRSFPPRSEPTRVFPRLANLLVNSFDNTEVLQTEERNYTFYLTVRDNHPGGGTADWSIVNFKSSNTAGPFFVMSPNNNEQLVAGQPFSITWDVANTDKAPVNCANVDIFLSDDGGENFDIILACNTANDGEETVIIPNNVTTEGRIKIKASNNIFFDISNFNFDINEAIEPSFYFGLSQYKAEICTPDVINVDINTESLAGFANDVTLSVETDLPESTIISFSNDVISGGVGSSALSLDFANVNATGDYFVNVIGTSEGAPTLMQTITLSVTSTGFDDFTLVSPMDGVSGVSELPTFEWTEAINGETYTIEYGTNPALGSTGTIVSDITGSTFIPDVSLEKNTVYYWKVYVENKCADAVSGLNAFATEALSCLAQNAEDLPANISASGSPTINSEIAISGSGQVTDVNVKNVAGSHQNVQNLTMTLVSPKGTRAMLVDRKCNFQQDFNCGFDDSAASEVNCPLSQGLTYLPAEPLSIFNGEEIDGIWTLEIKDNSSGDGGQFNGFELEICSNATLEGPQLINNETLGVPTAGANRINSDLLLTEDSNNTASELVYTIIELPLYGTMTASGSEVVVGSTFTQQDIDDKKVRYQHDGGTETEDSFFFTVVDGEGGWITLTEYSIQIGDFTSGIAEDDFDYFSMNVYPNPASDRLTLDINTELQGIYTIEISDITGKQVYTNSVSVNDRLLHSVDVSQYSEGMFIVKLANGKHQMIQLTTIQR